MAVVTHGGGIQRAKRIELCGGPPPVGNKALLAWTDFDTAFKGLWSAKTIFGTHTDRSQGCCTFRYVGGERRLLVLSSPRNLDGTPGGSAAHAPAKLWECRPPATYGTTATNAPELTVLRSWEAMDWPSAFPDHANGALFGDIYFHHGLNVLFYTMYHSYEGDENPPWMGAVRLNDDNTTTKYGPWTHPLGLRHYRKVMGGISEAPPSVQAQHPGYSMIIGGPTGSTIQLGNLGPGRFAFKAPDLGTTGVLPADTFKRLMGYAFSENPGAVQLSPDCHMRTLADYQSLTGSLLPAHDGTTGYWQASLHQHIGYEWIEGSNKWGIFVFGRRPKPGAFTWYSSSNPYTFSYNPAIHPPSAAPWHGHQFWDNSTGNTTTYHAGTHVTGGVPDDPSVCGCVPATWLFNPAHALEVGAGTRLGYDVSPYEYANWETRWNIPRRADGPIGNPATLGPGDWSVIQVGTTPWMASALDRTSQLLIQAQPNVANGSPRIPIFAVWDFNGAL